LATCQHDLQNFFQGLLLRLYFAKQIDVARHLNLENFFKA